MSRVASFLDSPIDGLGTLEETRTFAAALGRSGGAGSLSVAGQPLMVEGQGVSPPHNSELRKVADDVLGAVKMSFAAVARNPGLEVRAGSLEGTFKQALQEMSTQRLEQYKKVGKAFAEMPEAARVATFGRAGQRSLEEHVGAVGGFDGYDRGLPGLELNRKLLGLTPSVPMLSVPLDVLRPSDGGLLIPGGSLSNLRREFESAGNGGGGMSDFEAVKKALTDSAEAAEDSGVYDADRLADIWGPVYDSQAAGGMSGTAGVGSDFESVTALDKLELHTTLVKCVDETGKGGFFGSERYGNDEIAIAGTSVDETGDTHAISESYVGGGFKDGRSKVYDRRFTWFNMREGRYWPKKYVITMLLAEKDLGGFSKILDRLYKKISDRVREAISKAVGGLASSLVGPAIGKAIGEAVAWAVHKLIGWIINSFKDDVFPPFTMTCTVPSFYARWRHPNGKWGNPQSNIHRAYFSGHNGQYYVEYYWRLYS